MTSLSSDVELSKKYAEVLQQQAAVANELQENLEEWVKYFDPKDKHMILETFQNFHSTMQWRVKEHLRDHWRLVMTVKSGLDTAFI